MLSNVGVYSIISLPKLNSSTSTLQRPWKLEKSWRTSLSQHPARSWILLTVCFKCSKLLTCYRKGYSCASRWSEIDWRASFVRPVWCVALTYAANLVLQDAIERIFLGHRFGDVPKGTYIVRGENVVLMGEIDLDKEDQDSQSVASSIPESAVPQLLEALADENDFKAKFEKRRAAVLRRERGFSGEGAEGDSY